MKRKIFFILLLAMLATAGLFYFYSAPYYPGLQGHGLSNQKSPISSNELSQILSKEVPFIELPDPANPSLETALHIKKCDNKYIWASNDGLPLDLTVKTIQLSDESLIRPPEEWEEEFFPRNHSIRPVIPQTAPIDRITFVIFTNPDGKGFIIVPQLSASALKFKEPNRSECVPGHTCVAGCPERKGFNYIEYRLNDKGNFVSYIGKTTPSFPYPESDMCIAPSDSSWWNKIWGDIGYDGYISVFIHKIKRPWQNQNACT